MKPDLSSPESVIAQPQGSVDCLHSDPARDDAGLRERFRSAAIRAFEFACERALEPVRRQRALIVARPDALRTLEFADPMRDGPSWRRYRRNKTSHAWNVDRAKKTAAATGEFLCDARRLLAELGRRNRETG